MVGMSRGQPPDRDVVEIAGMPSKLPRPTPHADQWRRSGVCLQHTTDHVHRAREMVLVSAARTTQPVVVLEDAFLSHNTGCPTDLMSSPPRRVPDASMLGNLPLGSRDSV